jgi:hypothetical protein
MALVELWLCMYNHLEFVMDSEQEETNVTSRLKRHDVKMSNNNVVMMEPKKGRNQVTEGNQGWI